jgi:hypothetical protein
LRADAGDLQGAAKDYAKIAADSDISKPFQDLAMILGALIAINHSSADLAAVAANLQTLSNTGNPWRHSALEIMALIAQKSGDVKTAREFFQRLVDDAEAASGIRSRASQMLAIISPK